jgi:acetyl esterase/lipase
LVGRTAIVLSMIAAASGCTTPDYLVTENIAYDSAIDIYGMLDVYEPPADSQRTNRPALIAIHGGAWKGGDKVWGENIAAEFCPYGYVVISVNYRLSGRLNAKWPAQIEDVQRALRYVRANAKRLRVDPDRIASIGMSAGGHLATMLALRDDPVSRHGRVSVAVNLDGEHDMTMDPSQVMADFDAILTAVMGHPVPWSEAELRDISTVTFARPDVAVLSIHGSGDDNVYVAQGQRLTDALKSKGAETEFIRIDGDDGNCHEDCWRVPAARIALHRFIDRKLAHDGNGFYRGRRGKPSPFEY